MTYDYFCDDCKLTVEVRHSIKDNPILLCGKCKEPMRRKISGGCGFILKGKGFYKNDYKKSKKLYQPMIEKEKKDSD